MGTILQCEQCDHESKAKSALKEHHKSLHNMVKQKCLNWGSQFSSKGNLRRHVESLHEGKKYLCDACEYITNKKDT